MEYMCMFALLTVSFKCDEIMVKKSNEHQSKGNNETSAKTEGKEQLTAMDRILVANRQRYRYSNQPNIKRMNITKVNDSAFQSILEANEEQDVSNDLFEGDIVLNRMDPDDYELMQLRQADEIGAFRFRKRKRQASRQMKRLWHTRKVPYVIDWSLHEDTDLILRVIRSFNEKSCVKFVPSNGLAIDRNRVKFAKRIGCFSSVGRAYHTTGEQIISIGKTCNNEPVILHEMLHAVGLFHEQSRPDRNRFVRILWENISCDKRSQFEMYSHGEIDQFKLSYDYESILHYGKTAFNYKPNLVTIEAIQNPGKIQLGNDKMSAGDINELNVLYDCRTTSENTWTNWGSFSPCNENCEKVRQRYCYGQNHLSCGGQTTEYGVQEQRIKCTSSKCPVRIDGHWGPWGAWKKCPVNCNEGIRTRTRKCDDPSPEHGGTDCPESGKLDQKLCIRPRCVLGEYDWDFRTGVFGRMWQNDVYDIPNFDWSIAEAELIKEPCDKDTDRNPEYYTYAQSSGRNRRENARLISRVMPATGVKQKCFKFSYRVVGDIPGSLTVYKYPIPGSPRVIFQEEGKHVHEWKFVSVTIDSFSTKYQLVLEAVFQGQENSYIAVKELFIDEGSCDCQDVYVNCFEWSKIGHCSISYNFMNKNCRKACSFCGCADKEERCPEWGEEECKRNPSYMETKCPLTCRRCHCHDQHLDCKTWEAEGECLENPTYMLKFCPKSCNVCKNHLPN